jgi:gamma-glutamylcyclotransferase (GGCT)/AIG2-like uncharacterized protein YtfP
MLKVFVYGTLKPGYANYQAYCGDRTVSSQPARVRGQLFDLSVGYPAMIRGEDWVKGYVLSFVDDETLAGLDKLEDYQGDRPMHENLYQREWVTIFSHEGRFQEFAWTYIMPLEKVQKLGGILIPNGMWR